MSESAQKLAKQARRDVKRQDQRNSRAGASVPTSEKDILYNVCSNHNLCDIIGSQYVSSYLEGKRICHMVGWNAGWRRTVAGSYGHCASPFSGPV